MKNKKTTQEKDWSAIAENYDELQLYITGETTNTQVIAELSQLKNLGEVLEFGCGTGNFTKVLANNSDSIVATDISEPMLTVAKKRLADIDNVSVQQANCYATNLPAEHFDNVFMGNLIHVVAEPEKALAEAHRLLKPDGRLIILSYTTDGMSLFNILKMIYRYLKVFGKPPKDGTKFSLKMLTDFVNIHQFSVEQAKLLGNKQSKAIFLVARKVSDT